MTNLFFISDPHFSHKLLVPIRGFKSEEEMDEHIIESINKTVRPSDHLYLMGDIAIARRHLHKVKRLNGHKRLIFGNHDIFKYQEYAKAGFGKMMAYRVIDRIIFSHIPVHENQLRRFSCNVHGHTHESRVIGPGGFVDDRYMNVCCEVLNYKPISLEEIKHQILFG